MDLKIDPTFTAGSTFVFCSWVYTADDSTILHRFMKNAVNQASPALYQNALEDLVENFDECSISSLTQTRKQLKPLESNSSTTSFPSRLPSHRETAVEAQSDYRSSSQAIRQPLC